MMSNTHDLTNPIKIALLGSFPVRTYFGESLTFTKKNSLEHPSSPIVNLAHLLSKERNIELHVITLHPHLKDDSHFIKNNINYHFLRGGRLSLQILTLYELDRKRIITMLEQIRPSIIQAFGTEGPYAYAAVTSTFPSVVYMQGIVSELVKYSPPKLNADWIRLFLTQFIERSTVKIGRDFIVETTFSEQFVRKSNPRSNIFLIKNLINPFFFQVDRNPEYLSNLILYVGRITASKGIFELFYAFNELAQEYPDLKMEAIGPIYDQDEKVKLINFIEKMDLGKRISLVGMMSAEYIAAKLAIARMMVYPSYIDTSPNSIYEAMAVGVPVIATEVGGIPNMIENMYNGILVQKQDPCALMNAMRFLLNNPRESQRIGRNAKRTTRLDLNPIAAIEKIKKIHCSVIESQ